MGTENGEGWSENTSRTFIDNGAFFVPSRKTQMEAICTLVPDNAVRVVDLCCGEGLLSREILATHPSAKVIALDGSLAMLRATETRLADFRGRFSTAQFDLHAQDWHHFAEPINAFVSSLAIHHLDELEKQRLFSDLYQALSPGGVIAIADVISPATREATQLAAREWDVAVIEQSRKLRGDDSAFDAFVSEKWNMYANELDEIDKPSRLFDQLLWLNRAGFDDVDVYWMRAGHAVFGGRKRKK